jgi:putative membrane protein
MRRAALIFGLLTLGLLWLGPIASLFPGAFSRHMTVHIGVVAVAAPMIALGSRGGRFDPVRLNPRLFAPVPASLVELVVVWVWHAPALHHGAQHAMALGALEQALFFLSALFVWSSSFGGDPEHRGDRTGAGVAALLLTSMHMTLLGAIICLAPRPLYGHADLEDQQLGGAIMLLVGGLSYLLGGLRLTSELLTQTAYARAKP